MPPDRRRAAAAAETAADERVSLASNKANGSTGFLQALTDRVDSHEVRAAVTSQLDTGKSPNVRSLLDSLAGLRIAGGCADCDAFTEVRSDSDGVYIATVRHDDGCADLARRRRTRR